MAVRFQFYLHHFVKASVAIKLGGSGEVHLDGRRDGNEVTVGEAPFGDEALHSMTSATPAHLVRLTGRHILQSVGCQQLVDVVNDAISSGVIALHDPRAVVDPD